MKILNKIFSSKGTIVLFASFILIVIISFFSKTIIGVFQHKLNGEDISTTANVLTAAQTLSSQSENGVFSVKTYGAVGDGIADDTKAIQKTIDATPAGGIVFLPGGSYLVSGSLTLTKRLTLRGTSGSQTLLLVKSTVSTDTDIIVIAPTSLLEYARLEDFRIMPQSGIPGRHAIYLDGSKAIIEKLTIHNLMIGAFGSTAIYSDTNSFGQGTPRDSEISNCYINGGGGGIAFTTAGDSVYIGHNQILGPGTAINVGFQAGASTLLIDSNYIFADGGIHLGSRAVMTHIINNEFEVETATASGSNGAYVDVDGTSSSRTAAVIIRDNSFQLSHAGSSINGIRVNYADTTHILGNFFEKSPSGLDIQITKNALATVIGPNNFYDLTHIPIHSRITDNGIGTSFIDDRFPTVMIPGTSHTLTALDSTVFANGSSGAFTLTLPSAVGITGKIYTIKKIDSTANVITVAATSNQTIDGATTYLLSKQWEYVSIQSNGTNWMVIGGQQSNKILK